MNQTHVWNITIIVIECEAYLYYCTDIIKTKHILKATHIYKLAQNIIIFERTHPIKGFDPI